MFGVFASLNERIKDFLDDSPKRRPRNPARKRLAAGEERPIARLEMIAARTAAPGAA